MSQFAQNGILQRPISALAQLEALVRQASTNIAPAPATKPASDNNEIIYVYIDPSSDFLGLDAHMFIQQH